ncbi:hypothetical protein ABRP62_01400 [Corynebacterium sp. KPL2636]|uniref:hypothetical protein n=1 Tax=Corynebacterium sp. KPL2636 TaxID=3158309 RepID=UPI0032F0044C
MVVKHTPRHEQIDARVWDPFMSRWWPLAPWREVSLQARADWTVDTGRVTLGADHPQLSLLRQCRHVPVPVTFTINGVHWDGYVESVETGQNEDGTQYAQVNLWSEHKHFHRMLARSTVTSAADSSADTVSTHIGDLTHRLVSNGAVRTGLPTYVLVESEGDPVEVEVRTEDYVADVLDNPLSGSDSFVEVRKLLPGQKVPGRGVAKFYTGVMERRWVQQQLGRGMWPNAVAVPRIVGAELEMESPSMPDNSWHGEGQLQDGTVLGEPKSGICWLPFETLVERPIGYYDKLDPAEVFVTSREEVRGGPGARAHRPHFVTHWGRGTFEDGRVGKLEACAGAGLLRTPEGEKLQTTAAAYTYIDGDEAYAWKEGVEWVLATPVAFEADNAHYRAEGDQQRQVPGTLVWQHQGRDRRGVVFSSAPGGGLRKWSTTETGPDGAMLIGGGQLDAQTIAALESGVLQPKGTVGRMDAESASAYLPTSSGFPSEVEKLDIDVQPHATIDGTEVSFSKAGGRVNIAQAGPFFLREKYMNLSSTGGTNPTAEIAREWARSQGTTAMSLAPGHHQTVVFGDDVILPDGRVVPGWKPGDRVSFVDKDTRVSEVIMGYTLKSSSTSVLEVEPILGREENGVMASLERKMQAQEKAGRKALLAPARKVPQGAVKAVVDESTDRLDKSLAELSHEMLDTVKQSEFSRYDSNLQARLWGSQGEFNDITAQFQEKQEQINSAVTTAQQAISENIELNRQLGLANEKANEANRRATEAVRVAQESISRDMSRDIFANRDESVWDSFLRIDMPKLSRTIRLMAKGEWTGVVILSVQYSSGDLHRELVHIGEERFYNVKIPLGDVANALASYQVRTGTDYGQGESDN